MGAVLITIVVAAILAVVFFVYVKDQIISFQLTKDFKMPIKVRGMNFNLSKLFGKDQKKITLKLLAIGEGESTINLENIEIYNIRKNAYQPDYCLDGHVLAEKMYLGHRATSGCSGGLDFICVPYIPSKQKNPHIIISNALLNLGNSKLNGAGVIDTDMNTEISSIQLRGALSRGVLSRTLACLNADTDQVLAEVEIPGFQVNFSASDKVDPLTNISGQGSFNLYQGQFKFINLIEPIINEFKATTDANKASQGDNFDKLSGNFSIRDQKVYFSNILLSNKLFSATGQGSIGFDNQMDLSMFVHGFDRIIPLQVGQALPGGTIPLKITGRTDKPQIRPDIVGALGQVAKDAVDQALNHASEALQKLWN